MKWGFILLCVMALLFASCGGETSDEDAIRDTIKSFNRDREKGNWEKLHEYFSEDCRQKIRLEDILRAGHAFELSLEESGADFHIVAKDFEFTFDDEHVVRVTFFTQILMDSELVDERSDTRTLVKEEGAWKLADCDGGGISVGP